MHRILKVITLNAANAAKDVAIGYRPFLIQNASESAIYFKEKAIDGENATSENGFCVAANATVETVLTASVLSVFGGTVKIMLLEEG